ncbi:MAG: hypothetical protein LBF67_09365 [Prevotellaceae bacterium]|jgi:hypothetical protein|nr:hypothetical protein [Prevotellaceae bacterium]
MRHAIIHTALLLLLWAANARAALHADRYFDEVTLAIDTSLYALSQNTIVHQRKYQLYLEYNNRYATCELRFYPKEGSNIQGLSLVGSAGYEVLDSLIFIEDEACYRMRLRFADLFTNTQLSILLNVATLQAENAQLRTRVWELALFPYTQTWVKFFPANDILFVGEEKSFEVETNNLDNIKLTSDWQSNNGIDYRMVMRDGRLMLVLQPRELGVKNLDLTVETLAPFLNKNRQLSHTISLQSQPLTIKASRLVFLNLDKKEVTYDDEARYKGVSVVIDNNRRLLLNRTYRIENQEAAGGSLIGELFTVKDLANDKVLCKLTVFNLHRNTEGYLYIKMNDVPTFITNLDITPQMQISAIHVLHEGSDWQTNTKVNPGEVIDVIIEGKSLHKARFAWQDAIDLTSDTINQTETRRLFKLQIPMSINKRQVALLNNGQPTGKPLTVEEYQHPRPFDFITLNYGNKEKIQVNTVSNTIISRNVIKEFSLSFDKKNIDTKVKLYGKQYLDIDVRILGKRGEIIEMRSLKNQLVCPDETSPRSAYYKDKSCLSEDINLNNILSTKPSTLDNFGKVQLDVKNSAEKYSEPIFEKRVEVIYQPKMLFDIDLSLPAGMLIQNLGESQSEKEAKAAYNTAMENYNKAYAEYIKGETTEPTMPTKVQKSSFTDNLGGISIALIAQFSFTDNEKAGKMKPYRCGAGFLFINTFNFRENAKRDLAFVALGSIYPLSSRRMFNVPIHVGLGYKLQEKIPFVMISPGISVSF